MNVNVMCDKNDIADELHYLLICPFFAEHRSNYIDRYFYRRPNILNFKELLCLNSDVRLKNSVSLLKFFSSTLIIGIETLCEFVHYRTNSMRVMSVGRAWQIYSSISFR